MLSPSAFGPRRHGASTERATGEPSQGPCRTALLYIGPLESKRFVDVGENVLYWYFVVLSWLPIYAVIYIAPRI